MQRNEFINLEDHRLTSTCNLWGNISVHLEVDFPGKTREEVEASFEEAVPRVRRCLDDIQSRREEIGELLLEEGVLDKVREWISTEDILEENEVEVCLLEDGRSIIFPIPERQFLQSLYVDTIRVIVEENMMCTLYLRTTPDYIMGRTLKVDVKGKDITLKGIDEKTN